MKKKCFYTMSALMALAGAMSLSSCSKGTQSSSGGGDTIRIEAPEDGSGVSAKLADDGKLIAKGGTDKIISLSTSAYCGRIATMDAPYKYLGSEPAIVDFWATWCGPCRALAPVLEQLSAETGITIYKVDVDQCGDLANMYNISYIPQLYYCANGKITPIENKDDNYSLASLKRIIGK